MAQMTGYQCDVCDTFSVDTDGWVKVVPYTKARDAGPTPGHIDVCSAKCLIKLGRERDGGTSPARRTYTAEQKAEVVKYALEHSANDAAMHYGIHDTVIRGWIKKQQGMLG